MVRSHEEHQSTVPISSWRTVTPQSRVEYSTPVPTPSCYSIPPIQPNGAACLHGSINVLAVFQQF